MKLLVPFFCTISFFNSGCSESSGSGNAVDIPTIRVECTTADCLAGSNPRIFAYITTSGCESIAYGYAASMSTESITCANPVGCVGTLKGWEKDGVDISTVASGTYSICVLVDHDRSYAGGEIEPQSGDSFGVLDDVAIGEDTDNQFVTTFTDTP